MFRYILYLHWLLPWWHLLLFLTLPESFRILKLYSDFSSAIYATSHLLQMFENILTGSCSRNSYWSQSMAAFEYHFLCWRLGHLRDWSLLFWSCACWSLRRRNWHWMTASLMMIHFIACKGFSYFGCSDSAQKLGAGPCLGWRCLRKNWLTVMLPHH